MTKFEDGSYTAEYDTQLTELLKRIRNRAEKSRKWFANGIPESSASLAEVEQTINNGDLALFSGRKPHSFLIRSFSYSKYSHAGMFVWEDGILKIGDVCEGRGGAVLPADELIAADPGRWYWSHVSRRRFPDFSNTKVKEGILEFREKKYGYLGILLQIGIHLPLVRELAYAILLDRLSYFKLRPFCSQGVLDIIRERCPSCDPVPDRTSSLVVPQDLAQSRLWHPMKVALYP